MKVFVVIVTFNAQSYIKKCFGSLRLSKTPIEIIAIDNNSTDLTCSTINQDYQNVTLINSPENLGFGKANNIGIKLALEKGADYIFLLNQDAWIQPETIEILIQAELSFRHLNYGILSPIHLNGAGNIMDYAFSTYVSPPSCENLLSDLYLNKLEVIYDVQFVNAAAWLLTADCIKDVGGFDPIFFHYGEDSDYINRVKFHGYKIGVVPSGIIYHDREDRRKKLSDFKSNSQAKNISLLVRLTNINKKANWYSPLSKEFLRSLLGLATFNKIGFLEGQLAISYLMKNLKKVKVSRAQTKQKGLTYL